MASTRFPSLAYLAGVAAAVAVGKPWLVACVARAADVAVLCLVARDGGSPGPPVCRHLLLAVAAGVTVGAALLVVFGAPNRRPVPAPSRSALREGGLDVAGLTLERAEGGRSQLYVADGRRRSGVRQGVRHGTAATPTCSTAATARSLLRGPNDELAVAVPQARRRARGVPPAAGRGKAAWRVPASRRSPRFPTARWCSRSSTSTAGRSTSSTPTRSTTGSSTRRGARFERCTVAASRTARSVPRNVLVDAGGPVIIDLGFGEESATPRMQAIDRAELLDLARRARRAGARRRLGGAGGRSGGAGGCRSLSPAARALGGDPRASLEVVAERAARRRRRGHRAGARAARAAGAGPAAHAPHDRRAGRRLLRAAAAARQRRRQLPRAALGELGVAGRLRRDVAAHLRRRGARERPVVSSSPCRSFPTSRRSSRRRSSTGSRRRTSAGWRSTCASCRRPASNRQRR